MFKPFRISVEYQSNDYTKSLEKELVELRRQVETLKREVDNNAQKAIYEMHVNNELLDILREHGIYHRPSADLNKYYK